MQRNLNNLLELSSTSSAASVSVNRLKGSCNLASRFISIISLHATALRLAVSRKKAALIFVVRFCVLKST